MEEGGDGRLSDACLSVAHFMLALGVDDIGPLEDHVAFPEIEKAVPILACRASFLGCRLLAFSFFRPAGLSQEALEELVVLVEVLDGALPGQRMARCHDSPMLEPLLSTSSSMRS